MKTSTERENMDAILVRQGQHRGLRPAPRKAPLPEEMPRTLRDILIRQARIRRLVPRTCKLWPAWVCR
ncbi:MAG: hypothetical protein EON60_12965 [Alphaproteobacteria bacterium]|nr:MAG: hypothetical protein EON60_12965 [Alphaproteobacteria bacterium]